MTYFCHLISYSNEDGTSYTPTAEDVANVINQKKSEGFNLVTMVELYSVGILLTFSQ